MLRRCSLLIALVALMVVAETPLGNNMSCAAEKRSGKREHLIQKLREAKAAKETPPAKTDVGGSGSLVTVGEGEVQVPVAVVRGTPYEMGYHLGRLLRDDVQQFVPITMAGLQQATGIKDEMLRQTWARTSAFGDDRVEQEMLGLADGSGVPLATLQALHSLPLLMPYSCSSIAAWGKATEDGHLYQTRNLDWNLEVGAHEHPVVVVYIPTQGAAHVVPSFAGMIGAHTGMSARGLALSEMGDAPEKEAPYNVDVPHFTIFFRTLLYDADSLTRALEVFKGLPHTKRYHYVFGDGRADNRAVKIVAHTPEPPERRILIYSDNDPKDEFAPNVLENVVYNDEGRGAFPLLKQDYGTLNADKMIAIAKHIPIKNSNVVDVVYDATAMRLWVAYAKGDKEAYERPFTLIDLMTLDADKDGKPDCAEAFAAK